MDTADTQEYPDLERRNPEKFQKVLIEHAVDMGMDLDRDQEFLWIARESFISEIPEGWIILTSSKGVPYYYNETSGDSREDHSNDEYYKEKFRKLKDKKEWNRGENTA